MKAKPVTKNDKGGAEPSWLWSRRASCPPQDGFAVTNLPKKVLIYQARRPVAPLKHLSLCLLLTAAIQSLCYADVTNLPAEDRKALVDVSRFHEVHSTKDLPPAVVALCVDDKGKLADPGQNWNATDATTDPTLPWKRLIWAAAGSDYYVVHYERGGIDHSFHILVAKLAKNDAKPKVIWHAIGHQLKDYTAFLDALRAGKLDDRVDYPR